MKRNSRARYTAAVVLLLVWVQCFGAVLQLRAAAEEADSPFTVIDHVDGTVTITGYNGTPPAELDIPAQIKGKQVSRIGMAAFYAKQITKVILPEGLKEIDIAAFMENKLTELEIPVSVEKIGLQAFDDNQLTRVNLPEGLKEIDSLAFSRNMLTEIEIPGSVEKIGIQAFAENQLTRVSLHEGLKEIGDSAFFANRLTEVEIPESIKRIENLAFLDNSLLSIVFKGGVESVASDALLQNDRSWYTDALLTQPWDGTVPSAMTIYSDPGFYVEFDSRGGSAVAMQTIDRDATQRKISEPTPPLRQGYVFGGWYEDAEMTQVFDFNTPITANRVLHAKWLPSSGLLSQLEISSGMLSPAFTSEVTRYQATIASHVNEVELRLKKGKLSQTLIVTGAVYQSVTEDTYLYSIPMQQEEQIIRIEVRAEDASEAVMYEVSLHRPQAPVIPDTTDGGNTGDSGESGGEAVSRPQPQPVEEKKADEVEAESEPSDTNVAVLRSHLSMERLLERLQRDANPRSAWADVKGHWGEDAIQWMAQYELVTGYADERFHPDKTLTRAEWVVLLSRLFEVQEQEGIGAYAFRDTKQHWAEEAIVSYAAAGIVQGQTEGEFRPNEGVTREQMAVILSRMLMLELLPTRNEENAASDLQQAAAYAQSAIKETLRSGVVSGKGEGRFDPKGLMTRAEAVQVLMNMIKLLPETREDAAFQF